ncbi:MAG: hypothetical protein PVI59_02010 [Anaerolineae bacterium]|jgi:hypothetical protein
MKSSSDKRLALAALALRQGDRDGAREIVHTVLKDEPRNVDAWIWACEIAVTREERILCLKRVLALDPTHAPARRYLRQLEESTAAGRSPTDLAPPPVLSTKDTSRHSGPLELLLGLQERVARLSPIYLLLILAGVIFACGLAYFNVNSSFFGLVGPDFASFTVSDSHDRITAADLYWEITFEGETPSQFSGVVRQVVPIRTGRVQILTHDILVASGDFADPDLVRTNVVNHHFTWRATSNTPPEGRINLLHAVPADEAIYDQLLSIRRGDQVVIEGREIVTIRTYDHTGRYLGKWEDAGCNTLLVESVRITGE